LIIYINENISSDSIIVYHGTNNQFQKFNDNAPIFFVDDIEIARTYGRYIIKAILTMDNPIYFDFNNGSTFYFQDRWFVPSALALFMREIHNDMKKFYSLDDDLIDELESHDFSALSGDLDGMVMENIKDSSGELFSSHNSANNYVVFNTNQIKIIK